MFDSAGILVFRYWLDRDIFAWLRIYILIDFCKVVQVLMCRIWLELSLHWTVFQVDRRDKLEKWWWSRWSLSFRCGRRILGEIWVWKSRRGSYEGREVVGRKQHLKDLLILFAIRSIPCESHWGFLGPASGKLPFASLFLLRRGFSSG